MRTILLCFLTLSLLSVSCEQKSANVSATNFHIVRLGDGVYACINTFGGKAICNAGIVDNGEATIIFDTFLSPDAAEELIRVVGRLNLSPIRYVVNSHYHNDHVRGNQSFSPEVKILSTRRTAELITSEEPKSLAAEKVYGIESLEAITMTLMKEGAAKEEIAKVRIPENCKDWWFEDFFRGNVEFLYDAAK